MYLFRKELLRVLEIRTTLIVTDQSHPWLVISKVQANSFFVVMDLPFSTGKYVQPALLLEAGFTSVFLSKNNKYPLRC